MVYILTGLQESTGMENHNSVLRYGNLSWGNLSSIPASVCWNQRRGFAVGVAGVVSGAGLSRYVALRCWAESTVVALSEPRTRLLCLASRLEAIIDIPALIESNRMGAMWSRGRGPVMRRNALLLSLIIDCVHRWPTLEHAMCFPFLSAPRLEGPKALG